MFDKYVKLLAMTGSGKRVLDVGCADGYLSRNLNDRGNEVVGIEISPERVARARQAGVEVVAGDIGDESLWQQLPGRFDVAIFSDVLEHIRQPQQVLEWTRRILNPGGCVIISLPNIAYFRVRLHLLSGRFEYTDEGILDKTHVHFYTLSTARRLIESSGYVIQNVASPSDPRNALTRSLLAFLLPRFPNVVSVGFIFKAVPR